MKTPTTTTSEPLLNQQQAAELIGVESRTLEAWRATKRYPLPFIRIGPRVVRYRPSDISAFLQRQTVTSEPATA